MIRSFDWRDVGLVKTLADRGVCLDSETGLTEGNHPLQHALVSYLMPMAGAPKAQRIALDEDVSPTAGRRFTRA